MHLLNIKLTLWTTSYANMLWIFYKSQFCKQILNQNPKYVTCVDNYGAPSIYWKWIIIFTIIWSLLVVFQSIFEECSKLQDSHRDWIIWTFQEDWKCNLFSNKCHVLTFYLIYRHLGLYRINRSRRQRNFSYIFVQLHNIQNQTKKKKQKVFIQS